jgi:hypothetical protein
MWLFTPRGFFSAVQKPEDAKDQMMTIRARAKKDLENLHDILPAAAPYEVKGYSDYPWRIRVSQRDWAMAVATMALEIDYSNFKDEITRTQGKKRHDMYSQIWGVMLQAETGKKKYSYGSYADRDWAAGDRIWDSYKKKAATVVADDGKDITVVYDDELDLEQRLQFRGDAKSLRVVGDRVWDGWTHRHGEITSVSPLVVLYEDGSFSDSIIRLDDLEDPHLDVELLADVPKLFDAPRGRSVGRSAGKRGKRKP